MFRLKKCRATYIALVSSLALPAMAAAPSFPIVASFTTTLEPGVFHGFFLGFPNADHGYVAEITPLRPAEAVIEQFLVQPEFDGTQWNDVLRVQLRSTDAPLKVHIRAYETSPLPVFSAFATTLQPGFPHGFLLGDSTAERGFVTEITPLDSEESVIEKYLVQPEFDGANWNDMLRVQLRSIDAPLDAHIRVYEATDLPVVTEFTTTLLPGESHGFSLGDASADRGYITDISPLQASTDGAHIERYLVQPEFDGMQWNDVLRIQIPIDEPALEVHVRVYAVESLAGGAITGVLPKRIVCINQTTGQTVVIRDRATTWDCEAAGLSVRPKDRILQKITGVAD